mmetsp:Transcript_40762/g.102609  ORF Transcript_40762/g.102609 Transcript_40762/m.102609 type:complete len:448 (+) Transcript_40762:147-1490(+)|eukprot:CAMPEP_0177646498 /NCGR_PEP_ID=MMETSP0447-20121125/9805_1 /TAXON_ID=0 /ORGANISM="Stygamoeba regulata, Strain BSH-02190019" /LENGTH=447 /DNA_ID=CAMNT_0019149033 /DNA_START=446 /DNA_END=1789 /DNA_ORIENTATION=-
MDPDNSKQQRYRLRVRNAAQVVCIARHNEPHKRTVESLNDVCVIENGSLIVDLNGCIAAVGAADEIDKHFENASFDEDIDASGMTLLPGLVDAHTHAVWSGDRVHEFASKLAGATYMDIHKAGGGIGFTVRHTRESTADELYCLLVDRLQRMVRAGTAVVEIKSGYGLEKETELKMLQVITRAAQTFRDQITIVSTYLGAHSIPQGSTAAEATKDILERQLPAIMKTKADGSLQVDHIDVFLEKGVFEREHSRAILEAGQHCGLELNFHGDELTYQGAGELAGELGALAVSHLEHVSEAGIVAMAKRPTFAVLLPTTAYVLRISPPPARALIAGEVPVALGSDFNPNAHCLSMPMVMNLACVTMKMTMSEALVGATLNAAAALGKRTTHGSLEVGKQGDLLLLKAPRWEHLIYQLGDPPIEAVFHAGRRVFFSSSASFPCEEKKHTA